VGAGAAAGFTLTTQIYIKPGELMCRPADIEPQVGTRFRVNLFWMGRSPMIPKKRYKLKLAAARVQVELAAVLQVLDASELSSVQGKAQIDRHDVAECVLETTRPVAFDLRNDLEPTARFVLVDNYEIAGCGIILEKADDADSLLREGVQRREVSWEKGYVTSGDRTTRNGHQGKLIVFTGEVGADRHEVARQVERQLFVRGCSTYYLAIQNIFEDLNRDERTRSLSRDEQIQRLGEMARVMTDCGLLFLTTLTDVDDYDLEKLRLLNAPNELFVVNVGENSFSRFHPDVELPERPEIQPAVEKIVEELTAQQVIVDYSI
jgi:bifunctional enzyme CysN/CysC